MKYISYKYLVAKIVIGSFLASLLFAVAYSMFLKKEAIGELSKNDAHKTSMMAFEALYSGMEKGWNKQEIKGIINRLNKVEPGMGIEVYRSKGVSELFGSIDANESAERTDPIISRAMSGEEILMPNVEQNKIRYLFPIVAKKECITCHTNVQVGDINGVMDMELPIDNIKVSLSTMLNSFIIFFVLFLILLFYAMFFNLKRFVIKPIEEFIGVVQDIGLKGDIYKRVTLNTTVSEVKNIESFFNKMLDSLQNYYEQLRELSDKDYLTRLYNRKKFEEFLSYEIDRAIRHNHLFSVVMIDLDNFKYINDTYGHPVGDIVLKDVAILFSSAVRGGDIVARLGGDEFAIILPETTLVDALLLINRVKIKLQEHSIDLVGAERIKITASFGLAEFPTQGKTIELLMTGSDIAMYKAKKAGKNAIATADADDIFISSELFKKGEFIKKALETDCVEPFFQPIYDLKTNKIFAYEVLARIKQEDGYLGAGQFIEVAEELGLSLDIDRTIIKKGLDAQEKYNLKDTSFFFNISAKAIHGESFMNEVQEMLDAQNRFGIKSQVVFEILEREAIPNINDLIVHIARMKEQNISFALDDFGSGFSSFMYLKYFDVDFIKIDGEFIRHIASNEKDRIFVKHINAIAQEFGKKTIAEFVEDEETLNILKELGVDYAQGYHLGRPNKLCNA